MMRAWSSSGLGRSTSCWYDEGGGGPDVVGIVAVVALGVASGGAPEMIMVSGSSSLDSVSTVAAGTGGVVHA